MKVEFDHPTRGQKYRQANREFPRARQQEILRTLQLVNPKPGEQIVDFGCGAGALTYELSKLVAQSGRVYAMDNSRDCMEELFTIPSLNIAPAVVGDFFLPLPDNSVDAIVTLANFHHVKDKLRTLREFFRVTRPSGRIVIVDVGDETSVQRFFDSAVDAFCSTGHNHRFLNMDWTRRLLDLAGFEEFRWEVSEVPWVFANEVEAKRFVHTIFDATCSQNDCWHQTRQYLKATTQNEFCLEWQLAFVTARKPALGNTTAARPQDQSELALTA